MTASRRQRGAQSSPPVAALRLSLATLRVAHSPRQKTAPKPEAVEAVSGCYAVCARQHANDVMTYILNVDSQNFCFLWRTGVHASQRCLRGCKEIWTAHGKPETKLQEVLTTELDAEEVRYRAHSTCEKRPFDTAIEFRS